MEFALLLELILRDRLSKKVMRKGKEKIAIQMWRFDLHRTKSNGSPLPYPIPGRSIFLLILQRKKKSFAEEAVHLISLKCRIKKQAEGS